VTTPITDAHAEGYGRVRLVLSDTGEVRECMAGGRDDAGYEWESTSLDLALDLVPDIYEAIARARARGHSVDVVVSDAVVDAKPPAKAPVAFPEGTSRAMGGEDQERVGALRDLLRQVSDHIVHRRTCARVKTGLYGVLNPCDCGVGPLITRVNEAVRP
jgi:hypothetical protein